MYQELNNTLAALSGQECGHVGPDSNPGLEWTQKTRLKDQEFEVKEYALVSVDAYKGTIIWSSLFGQYGSA
jgi:hypothetical protein